jgi:hypothetical protein
MRKYGFYQWLAIATFGAMFFGATVARIETNGIMVYDLCGSFLLGLAGTIGCVTSYRAAKSGSAQ